MKALFIVFCMLVTFNLHADEDVYIVVYASFTPKNDMTFVDPNKKDKDVARVACYPIKYKADEYDEDMVEDAMIHFLETKDRGTRVHHVKVSSFDGRKEAYEHYRELTKNRKRGAKRIPFTKSHIDREKKLIMAEKEKEEPKDKPAPFVKPEPKPEPKAKPLANRAIDDIYD